jgi:hypothetical protein
MRIRHTGERRNPGIAGQGASTAALDTGFRRYDGNFLLHRAGAITTADMRSKANLSLKLYLIAQ